MKTNASKHYLLGTLLIWLGVLIWVPFLILQMTGKHPSFLWFLPFHLAGVVGGARLRAFARREMGIPPPKRGLLRIFGSILIALGILVWAPYFYLKYAAQTSVQVLDFLPFHLGGIFGGLLLLVINHMTTRKSRTK